MLKICIDFDGTIVEHEFPKVGKPNPGAIEWMKKFQEKGAELILFTMRSDGGKFGDVLTQAVQYIESNGVKLYGIQKDPAQEHWTSSPKAYGHMYIDDAAIGCPLIHPEDGSRPYVDWELVGPMVMKRLES